MKKLFTLVLISLLTIGYTKAQTVLFSENFSGGIPAAWSNTGTAIGAPNPYVKFRTSTTGAHGAYSASYGDVVSPTALNGVAIFDSDSLDNGGHTLPLPTGGPDQTKGPANSPHHVELTTTAINVAGHPYLRLQFYQLLAQFRATTSVGVSTDNINFVYDTLNADQAVNSSTPVSGQKIALDITSIVNGASTVYLRFVFDGVYYDWQIDDISIIELPDNDLKVSTSQGIFGSSSFNLFYSSIPVEQFGPGYSDSFLVTSTYMNIGKATQTNTHASFNETKGTTTIGNRNSTSVPSLAYGKDTFGFNSFPITGVGSYKVAININADSTDFDMSNNRDTVSFAVSDSVYSINASRANNSIAYFLLRSNAGVTFRMGSMFEVVHEDTVTSITTAIEGGTTGTHAGAIISASIYPIVDTVIAGVEQLYYNTPVISTFQKTLTAANITASNAGNVTPVVMPIDVTTDTHNPVLSPGLYWVALKGVSPAPNDSMILVATTPLQNGGVPLFESQNQLTFLSNTEAPYCNMNFGRLKSLLYAGFTWTPTIPYAYHGVLFNCNNTNASTGASYRWDISGLNTPLLDTRYGKVMRDTFTEADSVLVCLTVTDGNDSVKTCKYVKVRPNTGIYEVGGMSATLVPNPTTGVVKLTADDVNGKVAISITNMIGEEVKHITEEVSGSLNKSYNLSDLSSGMYIVKIQNGTNVAARRLSIVK